MENKLVTKEAIIEKYWPKPSESDSVRVMKEAIGKMMDEWATVESPKYVKWLFDTDCVDQSIGGSIGLNGSFDIEKTAIDLFHTYKNK